MSGVLARMSHREENAYVEFKLYDDNAQCVDLEGIHTCAALGWDGMGWAALVSQRISRLEC